MIAQRLYKENKKNQSFFKHVHVYVYNACNGLNNMLSAKEKRSLRELFSCELCVWFMLLFSRDRAGCSMHIQR